MSHTLLIVEDDTTSRETLQDAFADEGYTVLTAKNGQEALKYIAAETIDLVITDLKMPHTDGMTVLESCVAHCPVILITAHGTVDDAVNAMKRGAFDFVTKPVHLPHLFALAKRALEMRELSSQNDALRARSATEADFHGIIGSSPAMRDIYRLIEKVAPTDAAVCIIGESGTGKELVANAIHACSGRARKPFIKVNCAAIAENLLESELFGHEKGAFTGAHAQRRGTFERADEGSLLLDEISEMAAPLQAKLLRILQEQTFERVGGSTPLSVNVRIITATNADLATRIAEGTFREDLYYRIAVFPLHIPPLRERREDIPLLVKHFITLHTHAMNKEIAGISPDALEYLTSREWPGNVRELENCLARACVIVPEGVTIEKDHFIATPSPATAAPPKDLTSSVPNTTIEALERMAIEQALARHNGNKSHAAKALGIGVKTLYRKIEKYQIDT